MRSFALFLAWLVVGFVASFALLYGFTPAGPVILLIVWLGYRFLPRIGGSRRPEAFGALAGFGAFWVLVATTVDDEATSFATVGLVAVVGAILSYLVVGRNRCVRSAPSP
jgi:hypothetical protein